MNDFSLTTFSSKGSRTPGLPNPTPRQAPPNRVRSQRRQRGRNRFGYDPPPSTQLIFKFRHQGQKRRRDRGREKAVLHPGRRGELQEDRSNCKSRGRSLCRPGSRFQNSAAEVPQIISGILHALTGAHAPHQSAEEELGSRAVLHPGRRCQSLWHFSAGCRLRR